MGLKDISILLRKINEQQRTLNSFGSFAKNWDIIDNRYQTLNKLSGINWVNQNNPLLNQIAKYGSTDYLLYNKIYQSYNNPKTFDFIANRFFEKNIYISKNIASLAGQNDFISKIINTQIWGNKYSSISKYWGLINSMQSLTSKVAITGLSKSFTEYYYEDLETVASEVIELVDGISHENLNTNELIDKLSGILELIKNILTKGDPQALFGIWLNIISLFLGTYMYLHPITTSENNSNANEVRYKNLNNSLKKSISEGFDKLSAKRKISHSCKLYSKCKFRSEVRGQLLKGESIFVINTNGKWASIIIVDKDGLPTSGWMLKKYFSKK